MNQGPQCQNSNIITNSCSTSPCLNGGTCVASGNSYFCQCLNNYNGNIKL